MKVRMPPGKSDLFQTFAATVLNHPRCAWAKIGALVFCMIIGCGADAVASTQVSTLAGSGLSGFADGPPGEAEFMMPMGLATDARGNVYVADAGAQRIRVVAPSGYVSTLAGSGSAVASGLWVLGGYRDGRADQARFNKPSAVAVDQHGAVYVADAFNHCIRKIENGVVSTFAGSPTITAPVDGPRATAGFGNPAGLAFDSGGNLYVADALAGLRKISPDGLVRTITFSPDVPAFFGRPVVTGVSTARGVVFVAAPGMMFILDADGKVLRTTVAPLVDNPRPMVPGPILQDFNAPGYPYAVAALNNRFDYVYADTVSSTVRWAANPEVEAPLGARPSEDAQKDWSGYQDGPVNVARYNEPMGIAVLHNGEIVVADTGNRRIRLISGFFGLDGLASFSGSGMLKRLQSPKDQYTIVYIGTSSVWHGTTWEDSIPGQLEVNINRDQSRFVPAKQVHVVAIEWAFSLIGTSELIENVLADSSISMVFLQFNSAMVNADHDRPLLVSAKRANTDADWQAVTAELRGIAQKLASKRISFVVVIHPLPAEVSPLEDPYYRSIEPLPYEDFYRTRELLHSAVTAAGVPVIDLFPDFLRTEQSATHPALFGARDFHFSVQGIDLVVHTVLTALEQLRPWQTSGTAP